jgi:hypothetical protein
MWQAAHFDEFEILAAAAIFEVHTLVTEACEVLGRPPALPE